MATAAKAKQLSFEMPNRVGVLAEISAALGAAKINILSLFGIGVGDMAIFMLVTSDPAGTKKILKKMGAMATATDVLSIELPNKPGAFGKISESIARAGIDILTVSGTAGSAGKSVVVLKTSNDKKALKLLNAER